MSSRSKRLGLPGAALACVLPLTGPASAADWNGFYAGGSAGYGWGKADTSIEPIGPFPQPIEPTPLKTRPKGGLLGAQAGYNWQSGNLVYGAEAEFSLSGMKDTEKTSNFTVAGGPVPAGSTISSKQEVDWLATLRARLGYVPASDWLFYVTGGPAWGRVKDKANSVFPGSASYPSSESNTRFGWAAGTGVAWAMSKTVSVKIEYLHYDLGNSSDRANPVPTGSPFVQKYNWETKGNLLRAGVNFRF